MRGLWGVRDGLNWKVRCDLEKCDRLAVLDRRLRAYTMG